MSGQARISVADLLAAKLLTPGASLFHAQGESAVVTADGLLAIGDQTYPSPTAAHIAVRATSQNGWQAWRLSPERGAQTLASLRDEYRSQDVREI